jgi:hypothetical protein
MINRSSQGILWSASIHPSHPAIQMGADAGSLWQRTILSMAPPTLTTCIKSMGFESTHLSSYRTFPWPLVVEQMWRSSRSHPCLERSLTCTLPIGLSERGKYHHKPHGLQTPCKQQSLRGWWGNPWGFESPFGTIAILKGNLAPRQIPFFVKNGPTGSFKARGFFPHPRARSKPILNLVQDFRPTGDGT